MTAGLAAAAAAAAPVASETAVSGGPATSGLWWQVTMATACHRGCHGNQAASGGAVLRPLRLDATAEATPAVEGYVTGRRRTVRPRTKA